ncbi:MAG: 4-hydroxythreonine-4-phosphate dehydrogenase PdxA [Bacteroidota bacterium]
MGNNKKNVIGITMGDINGIGPEIIISALSDQRILNQLTPVLFGSSKVISYYRRLFKIDDFPLFIIKGNQPPNPKRVNLVECWEDNVEMKIGVATKDGGEKAAKALDIASQYLEKGIIDAVVTGPINKATIQSESFDFPGHTEYFGSKFNGDPMMFMISGDLRVAVLTGHMPLKDVPAAITPENITNKINKIKQSLLIDFAIAKPKIAVLGLNPHAGEEGLLGKEEEEVLIPAIKDQKKSGNLVYGPFPADGFFGSGAYQKYDAIMAMYHDQGLIPFKSLSFGDGVNFTAGLTIVRTSPDHGTAYNIAGKGIASASSLRSAIFMANDIIVNRNAENE